MRWALKQLARNSHQLTVDITSRTPLRVLHISDLHWDNPHCRRDLLKQHLDQAVETEAPILIYGDMYCAMQGKTDPRSCKSDLREEHKGRNYFDKLVETSLEWFEPYKDNIAVVGYGNHETAVLRHETDLIDRFASGMRRMGGIARSGGYEGWVRWLFKHSTQRHKLDQFYWHGTGGGGQVGKGWADFNRMAEDNEADMYFSGHIHRIGHLPEMRAKLDKSGKIIQRPIDYVRCGSYKEEHFETSGASWGSQIRLGARALGGYWMTAYVDSACGIGREFVKTRGM